MASGSNGSNTQLSAGAGHNGPECNSHREAWILISETQSDGGTGAASHRTAPQRRGPGCSAEPGNRAGRCSEEEEPPDPLDRNGAAEPLRGAPPPTAPSPDPRSRRRRTRARLRPASSRPRPRARPPQPDGPPRPRPPGPQQAGTRPTSRPAGPGGFCCVRAERPASARGRLERPAQPAARSRSRSRRAPHSLFGRRADSPRRRCASPRCNFISSSAAGHAHGARSPRTRMREGKSRGHPFPPTPPARRPAHAREHRVTAAARRAGRLPAAGGGSAPAGLAGTPTSPHRAGPEVRIGTGRGPVHWSADPVFLKGVGCDSQPGHMSRLWVQSLVGAFT